MIADARKNYLSSIRLSFYLNDGNINLTLIKQNSVTKEKRTELYNVRFDEIRIAKYSLSVLRNFSSD
ncbi:MAG: hypothetical protein HZR80_05700 [Candidatus Heimdallarchaeota archaeon]